MRPARWRKSAAAEATAGQRIRSRLGLRSRFVIYLISIHVVFAGVAVLLLWNHRPWLLGLELFFVLSALVALQLLRKLTEPLRQLRAGLHMLEDGEFTTRFRSTGHPELNALALVYNRVSERLREQRILNEEKESFLARVLKSTPSGVITFDFDQRIDLVNPAAAALLERPQAELVGRKLSEIGTPFATGLAGLAADDAAILVLRGRRRIKCQSGEFFDRGFTRRFLFLDELTAELRRSEKAAYDKLIRMMSHEVNNTTGAVNSLLQSCRRYSTQLQAGDRVEFETALDVAVRRTSHMNAFMRGFADVVRIPAPTRARQDLRALLTDILQLIESEAAERRIRIDVTWPQEAVAIDCDAPQIEQALVNVLRNSMEAIGCDGTIMLRTQVAQRKGGAVPVLVVEDSGPGLTPGAAAQLFTPFFTTKETGQGIGLTVVREILDSHGFEYALESAAGEPTRFSIVFG